MRRVDLTPQDAQLLQSIDSGKKDKFLTVDKLCKLLQISRSAYYKKRRNPDSFTFGEIRTIANSLEVPERELYRMIYRKETV